MSSYLARELIWFCFDTRAGVDLARLWAKRDWFESGRSFSERWRGSTGGCMGVMERGKGLKNRLEINRWWHGSVSPGKMSSVVVFSIFYAEKHQPPFFN